jgi:hypothetical protein
MLFYLILRPVPTPTVGLQPSLLQPAHESTPSYRPGHTKKTTYTRKKLIIKPRLPGPCMLLREKKRKEIQFVVHFSNSGQT